ncbi:uncharacterized protein LOC143039261 [Oratosquilla oratoria]|uniref:uncharacterized protein LOC143039261 n=1 Tax=Oratosquilla oratoria TaxID=337810 RepID=UPI003F7740F3
MDFHLSSYGNGELDNVERELHTRRKLQSLRNRRAFLLDCIAEQVVPKSTPQHLRCDTTPFSRSARIYLEESCKQLQYGVEEIKYNLQHTHLPNHLVTRLKEENTAQKMRLQRKLQVLCASSEWRKVGRPDLINNMSTRPLTDTETEALSLGLKFDTGIGNKSFTDYTLKNSIWSDTEAEKGFKQGVTACCIALSANTPRSLPRRYISALKELGKDNSIFISQVDKGGGVVIMDKADYVRKMEQLLEDEDTYTKKRPGHAKEEAMIFNGKVRKILGGSEMGRRLKHLIEEDPRPPTMRGLPKTHKPGVPMRPITSGIGSAPHRLAKVLAKPLSKAMGSISGSHLRNSEDLLRRLKGTSMRYKKMASYDVKSLFTQVPTDGALEAVSSSPTHLSLRFTLPTCVVLFVPACAQPTSGASVVTSLMFT